MADRTPTATDGALVLSIDQPYASLIMAGVKRFETRPAPPNGDMRPDGVRGFPGAKVNRGDRLLIASTGRKPKRGNYGPYFTLGAGLSDSDRGFMSLPLGCILGSVEVTDAHPMESIEPDGPEPSDASLLCGRVVYVGDGLTLTDRFVSPPDDTDITDQLPLGDWRPGRWAWALADPVPTTARCPRCDGSGSEPVPPPPPCPEGCGCRWLSDPPRADCACDGPCATSWVLMADGIRRPDLSPCSMCESEGVCDPVPVVGKQGVWRWTP